MNEETLIYNLGKKPQNTEKLLRPRGWGEAPLPLPILLCVSPSNHITNPEAQMDLTE